MLGVGPFVAAGFLLTGAAACAATGGGELRVGRAMETGRGAGALTGNGELVAAFGARSADMFMNLLQSN